ncbi:SDR family oxidoreductase [Variovorax sp. VNK109]|uniref:SDR family oxidoreductase n=1 Tax=Variovorax sp. VNK109 TaxID=3400919 RepID=UPI003C0865D1
MSNGMQEEKCMAGKVVVITGAGGGIGRDIALCMGRHGAKVVVNDVSDNADAVVGELRAEGAEAIASKESVAQWESAQRIITTALDVFGRIDCVVNNAGILRDRFFFNMSRAEWSDVLDVHLNGSFNVARAAAPHMKAQGAGAFVHMTSTSGLIGNLGQANYAAAKMGIVGLSKSIALDMAKFNVRSNCIAPWAWTQMTSGIPSDTPEEKARVEKFKRMESHKIAPLVVYLCSDLSSHVTAQIFGARANELYLFSQPQILRSIHRDGGWSVHSIAEHAIPAMQASFSPNVVSIKHTPWDPV